MAYIDKTFTNIAVGSTDSATKAIYITNIKLGAGESDDVASKILGGDWRMPTRAEFERLLNSCTKTTEYRNGIFGFVLTSNRTGNSLFFPCKGFKSTSTMFNNSWAIYPTKSKDPVEDHTSCYTFTGNDGYGYPISVRLNNRSIGMTIRPVSLTEGIDMGDTVKWASTNLSTTGLVEHDYDTGNYFAWGETETKSTYTWDNYKYGTEDEITKYNATDGLTELNPGPASINRVYQGKTLIFAKNIELLTDDAARAILGGKWRIPTKAEWDDLLKVVTVTKSGTNALMTFSDGQTLTFPAGAYWASTWVNDNGFVWAYSGVKSNGSTLNNAMQGNNRQNGNQIRAVISLSDASEEEKANGVIVGNVVWSKTNLVEPGTGNKYTRWGDPDKWFATTNDAKEETYKWYDYTLKIYTKYTSNDGLKELQAEYF